MKTDYLGTWLQNGTHGTEAIYCCIERCHGNDIVSVEYFLGFFSLEEYITADEMLSSYS